MEIQNQSGGLSLFMLLWRMGTMVPLKGTESSLCSVALFSPCWHVSRVLILDIILFEYFMTIPICIPPVVLWPLQPQPIAHLSKAILHYSAKRTPPVSHSSHPQLAPLPAQVTLSAQAHPGFCRWALLAAPELHCKVNQIWFTHCYLNGSIDWLSPESEQWKYL